MDIGHGLEYLHIYWVRGTSPKHWRCDNAVTDPPCSGWQLAIVQRGEKRSTIYCPYSLTAHTVRNDCCELEQAQEPPGTTWDQDRTVDRIHRNWKAFQGWGYQRDYDAIAGLLRRLGAPVPAQILTGGGEDTRKKGGKPPAGELLKPVKRLGKRGAFLKWFLDGDGSRSVRETMAELSMSRSNVLSYLFMLRQDHGLGYALVGDMVTVYLPEGIVDPFVPGDQQPKPRTAKADDDSWLD